MWQRENRTVAGGRSDSSPLAIGVLTITAVILLVGILVVSTLNNRAMAMGQTDRGGDYIMLTSQFDSNTENIIITDAATRQMIVYGWNFSTRRFEVWSAFDLQRLARGAVPNRNERRR